MVFLYVPSAMNNSLTIVDATNPTAPSIAGILQGAGPPNYLGEPTRAFVLGNLAYVTSCSDNSLTIIDISDPFHPSLVGNINGVGAPNFLDQAVDVFVKGNYAYVAAFEEQAITIIDVSNPAAPTFVSVCSLGAGHYPQSIFVKGNCAYVVARLGGGTFFVIDVTNPLAPAIIYTSAMSQDSDIFVDGDFAYITSSLPLCLNIFDVSNPAAAILVGSISGEGAPNFLGGTYGVFVKGNYAYVAAIDDDSLTIIDISDPTNPVFASHQTLTKPFCVHVRENYAYVSRYAGAEIYIVDVTDPLVPNEVGFLRDLSLDCPVKLFAGAGRPVINKAYALAREEL